MEGEPWYPVVFKDNTMPCKKLYLVEWQGALLMVRRAVWCQVPEPGVRGEVVARENSFEVFKADFEHSRWVKVSALGGLMFLGRRCSRVLSLSQYGVPDDHILFLDDDEENRMEYRYDEENTSYGTYDMRSGRIRSVHPNISWKRGDEMRLAAWLFPQD
ncbi:hypothetical protein D1007_39112 [Hordeum vulgare]|nr:hypothetical protein D1007_39112 [Hordeum vulgare]